MAALLHPMPNTVASLRAAMYQTMMHGVGVIGGTWGHHGVPVFI